jgi:hypothetical protein
MIKNIIFMVCLILPFFINYIDVISNVRYKFINKIKNSEPEDVYTIFIFILDMLSLFYMVIFYILFIC